ncbi:bifunctional hydroxymethylpyrimidine kinase/phosphomethylpyrimidine kinase [Halodesulfovibrio sp.]|jgi:hydroxymethylpyrimidine/phosphomethylpyrimidine kinase|uniref:bifunctional hydroxymethylpyrimidine kinase/phosphomethylpyrimidine kinase n=1 Tax=Halodesulfovibrio sp. TaxID=1912772 RepID=UPI0025F257A8|nr:bifunctional hydroxymethylpyrimidine kinase/phosphomethylpyrimidine kinase [Halodesulfovibrio sp.]MCT4534620.1 bifunctional hydroxymethylpyrimidine kinase/phosphomethylpyrimidine kinase [Halodesulfovibrio sp.]MCT4628242.1 bifunctional hydroxymethylpyrimidine kinase/phosphomethylpyrimidine kinase [Halodesulfovibrio sp.]
MQNHPCVLTIAGSDSGGGAGIQADLKTMAVLGGYGTSVITALTAQNGLGVTGIHAPDADFVVQQLTTVLDGFPIAAAKTGMLFSAPIITGVAGVLKKQRFPLVIDPVSVSTSGHALLQQDAVDALIEHVLPLAAVVTPNKPEAEMLAGMKIETDADAETAIKRIQAMGPKAVLLKGGHFKEDEEELVDWLGLPGEPPLGLHHQRIATGNTHGTGCTLSAAIATYLALGFDLKTSVKKAQVYLSLCLRESYAPGEGFGPPNHFAPCTQ